MSNQWCNMKVHWSIIELVVRRLSWHRSGGYHPLGFLALRSLKLENVSWLPGAISGQPGDPGNKARFLFTHENVQNSNCEIEPGSAIMEIQAGNENAEIVKWLPLNNCVNCCCHVFEWDLGKDLWDAWRSLITPSMK